MKSMLKNYWYVGCASSQLDNEPRAALLHDEPIVLFRDREGRPCALEDRCCHRGVQLSLGSLTAEGCIACRYHGWQYDRSGRCVHVPSLCSGAPVPAGFKVRSFPCIEQDHYVWVWMGDGPPSVDAPPRIRGLEAHGWTQGVIESACDVDLLFDNILDSSHIPFVHAGTHWGYFLNKMFGFKDYQYEVRTTDNGLAVFYPPTSSPEAPGHLDDKVASYLEFELPDRLYVFQRGVKSNFYLVLHMVSRGPGLTRVEWLMQQRDRVQGVQWMGSDNPTLQQDRTLLESAQGNYERAGADFERHVPADYPPLLARRLIALAREGQWPARREEIVPRKLVLVRQ